MTSMIRDTSAQSAADSGLPSSSSFSRPRSKRLSKPKPPENFKVNSHPNQQLLSPSLHSGVAGDDVSFLMQGLPTSTLQGHPPFNLHAPVLVDDDQDVPPDSSASGFQAETGLQTSGSHSPSAAGGDQETDGFMGGVADGWGDEPADAEAPGTVHSDPFGWSELVPTAVFNDDEFDSDDEQACGARAKHRFEVSALLRKALEQFGLLGARLAEQVGEHTALLHQLVEHLHIKLDQRDWFYHLMRLTKLIALQVEEAPRNKRFKGIGSSPAAERLYDACLAVGQSTTTRKSGPDASIAEALPYPERGQRRFCLASSEAPGLSREAFDARAKDLACARVIRCLERGSAPIIQVAKASGNSTSTLMGAIGATRAGTLTAYASAFEAFQNYLWAGHGIAWPRTVLDITDYLHMRASEPCAPSIPQVFMQSLAWFERTGGIPAQDRLSRTDLIKSTVDYAIELVACGGAGLKQAPRPPVVVLCSSELFIVNTNYPAGWRLKAFTMNLKALCTLREDDIQHLSPNRLRGMGKLLVAELSRTKTTGKSKRIKELPLALWCGASFTGAGWIAEGMRLMLEFGDQDRDYLLPIMSRDGHTAGHGPASYSSSSGLAQLVMSRLKRPVLAEGRWVESDLPLIHPLMLDFWTAHSPRAFMPSILAQLEVDSAKADFCGRWCPSGSVDYTRTFRSVVETLQKGVISAVRRGDERLNEDDIVDRVDRFATQKGLAAETAEMLKRHLQQESQLLADAMGSVEGREWALNLEAAGQQLLPTEEPSVVKPVEIKKSLMEPHKLRYLIIYTRNRSFARLHRVEGTACPWVRVQVQDCAEYEAVDSTMYNSRCKICWPRRPEAEESESSDSEAEDQQVL